MGTFTICLTKPVPPGNDNCTGAIVLAPALTCVTGGGGSQAAGTLVNATNSGIAAVLVVAVPMMMFGSALLHKTQTSLSMLPV
jgi:hypothetical protein